VTNTYDDWIGNDAYDVNGDKIGSIKDLYYDDRTGRPEWIAVKPGVFKGARLVPLQGSTLDTNNDLHVAFDKDRISEAPDIDVDEDETHDNGHLSAAQEQELYGHYGYNYDAAADDTGYGYGQDYSTGQRADRDYETAYTRTDQTIDETTEDVPVDTSVEIPVHTTVRLRRYTTQRQGTQTVQVPTTESEEHVEVVDTDADVDVDDVSDVRGNY
jgi:hypothetical protein